MLPAVKSNDMKKLEYEDLSEKVYKNLKDMILKSELAPGEKLVQEELSVRLGVSRTPLLSAFAKLEKELLVELVPRRGAFVRQCSNAELRQCYDIRMRLETLGAREAADAVRKTGASVAPLGIALKAQAEALATGNQEAIKGADYDFHIAVVRLGGNDFLYRMLSAFNIVLISNLRGLLKPAEKSLAEHRILVQAISSGDSDRAEALMLAHLLESRSALEGAGPERREA